MNETMKKLDDALAFVQLLLTLWIQELPPDFAIRDYRAATKKIKEARLSIARNCDFGNVDELTERFYAFCRSRYRRGLCPVKDEIPCVGKCVIKWMLSNLNAEGADHGRTR